MKYSIPFLALLIVACNHVEKQLDLPNSQIPQNFEKKESMETTFIIDTLVFTPEMNGLEMTKKWAHGQTELDFYKQFISGEQILEKQTLTDINTKTEITYLGKLMDLDGQTFYHVITNFKIIGLGEMLSPRGMSNVAFVSENMKQAIIYRMEMPEELPLRIENNVLVFNYESEKIGISIQGGLPPMLCVPKIGCN